MDEEKECPPQEDWREPDQPGRPLIPQLREHRVFLLSIFALALSVGIIFIALRPFSGRAPNGTLPSANPLLASLNLVRYDFVTPSLGWAVMNPLTPASSAGQFRVFRTVDGAKHWELQVTGRSSIPGSTPITVHFFDTTHGYMEVNLAFTGEQVYRTSDGGEKWQAVVLPAPECVVVTFSDATYAWALAQANPPSAQLFKLYATSDRGATWQRLPDPPGDAYYLAFRGPTEAWMGSLGAGPPHVYTSADAGRRWERHDLPPPRGQSWGTGGHGTIVQLLPQIGAVASTGSSTTGSSSEADLFTSFDLGTTWRQGSPPPGKVGYQDALHWWAIEGTVLSKSSDAGQTWRRVSDGLPDWQFVLYVLDSEHAWAELTVVGGYGLALTNDGGIHWIRANVPQG
jgi:photosystem II stability/assembly factor-like uncharacterized protein